MDREFLIERVGAELFGYLMEGRLSRDDFAAAIRPESLEQRYEEYEQLADLHFLLSEPVVEFVERLPQRLRQLKTETTRERQISGGAIQGRIDWSETYRRRVSGGANRSQYVCSNRRETRETPENLLLKYIVEELAEILQATEKYFDESTNWINQTWGGNQMLRTQFFRLREQNVHLQALNKPAHSDITPRMISKAENAREQLYRHAALLYSRYQRYQNGDEQILRNILNDATVLPEDEANLYELYVLFETINALDAIGNQCQPSLGSHTVKTLRSGRTGPAAVFDGEQEYNLFYDQSGQSLDCSFYIEPEVPPEQHSRGDAVATYGDKISSGIFGTRNKLSTKRPDILIAPRHPQKDPAKEYVIIEIKHSTNKATIKDGIREITQYLAYFRRDGDPVFEQPSYMGCGLNGLLLVGDREDIPSISEQCRYPITVIPGTELPCMLPELFIEIFNY